ncbi:MAG: hypothetical protein M3N54_11510 [Acidobacteriota bacterium]|nr:hypothetical protein [Acidobacteriota bacterium]
MKTALLILIAVVSANAAPYRFDFSAGNARAGFVKVALDAVYAKEPGYGYDLGTKPGEKPFFFSAAVPEGNYRVTATLGSAGSACVTTIEAESRRLMVEKVETAAGQFKPVTFIVNVRNFKIPPPPLNAPGGDQAA